MRRDVDRPERNTSRCGRFEGATRSLTGVRARGNSQGFGSTPQVGLSSSPRRLGGIRAQPVPRTKGPAAKPVYGHRPIPTNFGWHRPT